MRRITHGPKRQDYVDVVRSQGLVYVDTTLPDGKLISYWREGQYYALTNGETKLIGEAAGVLYQAFVEAGNHILRFEHEHHARHLTDPTDCYFRKMAIPEWAIEPIVRTWQMEGPDLSAAKATDYWPSVYGRFDLCLGLGRDDVVSSVKLLEFNADTPTSLVETAHIQWEWFVANHQDASTDQWNRLYDALVERWVSEIRNYQLATGKKVSLVHVACSKYETEGEDIMTIRLMGAAIEQAAELLGSPDDPAFRVKYIAVESIKRVPESRGAATYVASGAQRGAIVGHFADGDPDYGPDGEKIELIFKLHPWEHMLQAQYGFGETTMHNLLSSDPTIWVEPAYKMLWSNKGILPVLWELFRYNRAYSPYLLEAYFADDPNIPEGFERNCARKPLLGREGADVSLIMNGDVIETEDREVYGDEGFVVQKLAKLPRFDDPDEGPMYAVCGAWMVGDTPEGICFRESTGLITSNTSYFAPHVVLYAGGQPKTVS